MVVTLVTEDGSAKTDANGYIDLPFALAWHTNSGNDYWVSGADVNDTKRTTAIIRATFYIEKRFKPRYRGLRQTVEQSLGWPRIGAFDDDSFNLFGIPAQLMNATAEYALRALWYQTLAPDPIRTAPAENFTTAPPTSQTDLIIGPVKSKTDKVGPLESSVTYDGLAQLSLMAQNTTRASQSNMVNDIYLPEYPEADLWMTQLLRSPASGTRLIRGS